jgi:hypothetical protein
MARRFVSIKPLDRAGETPDRPSDEVLWSNLENVWFDRGAMKKRPALVSAAFTSIAATATASPVHSIVQYEHPIAVDASQTLRPNGAGNNTGWTLVGAASNWQAVDDIISTDSDYVSIAATATKDSYAFSNTTLTVLDKIVFNVRAQRHPSAPYVITIFARTGGGAELDVGTITVSASGTGITAEDWENYQLESLTDPHTSATWTATNVNAYEFGYYVSTLDTQTIEETLYPTGDGSDTGWAMEGGASNNAILAANAVLPTLGEMSSTYIYDAVNSEKAGVTFTAPTTSYSVITSIEPEVARSCLYGLRELEIAVSDGVTEELYLTSDYTAVDTTQKILYDSYVAETFDPEWVTWTSTDYTVDPLTDAAWGNATYTTYDWILRNNTTQSSFLCVHKLFPTSFSSTTGWNAVVSGTTYADPTDARAAEAVEVDSFGNNQAAINTNYLAYSSGSPTMQLQFENLPSLEYDSFDSVHLGQHTYYSNPSTAVYTAYWYWYNFHLSLWGVAPGTTRFNTGLQYRKYDLSGLSAATAESRVNESYVKPSSTSWVGGIGIRVYGCTLAVWSHPFPENRVHAIRLKVTGTSKANPAVSQFSITCEGATSTDRRVSKLIVSQTDFQRWDSDGATLTDIVGGATPPTVGTTQRWDHTRFFGKQYFTNGIDTPYKYPDATNTVDDLAISDAFSISSYIGRLFLGKTTESGTVFPDRVRWSIVGDDSDFTGTGSGYIDLDETYGDVVKLLPLGGTLVAYKDTSVFNLSATGDRDDAIIKQLISPGIGAVAQGTVLSVVARDGLPAHIFLGQGRGGYNVYMYTGNMLIPIGDDIKEELRDNLSSLHAKNAFAIHDTERNQYLFAACYQGETFPTRIWTYDIDTGAWKHWKVPPVTCAGTWKTKDEDSNVDQWELLFGQADGTVRWLDPDLYQDENSKDIVMIAESGDWAVEPRVKFATLYRLHIHYYDVGYTPIKVSVSTDGGDTYGDEEEVYLGQSDGSADNSLRSVQIDQISTSRRYRVRITHNDNNPIKISEVIMEIEEQGWVA